MNGRDLMELGVPEGPLMGRALAAALDAVVDGLEPNEREALRAFVAGWLAEQADAARR